MNTNNTHFNLEKIATGFVITAALGSFSAAFAAESIKASVNGMVCAFCAQGIEKRLSKMPATKSVFVDLKKKIVAVEAREGQTLDGRAITAEITDAGYDVVRLETVQQSVADIRAAVKAQK
ncbi:MAG: heavy metal-associated domain-containing protein [Pseudomonadota bacterium]